MDRCGYAAFEGSVRGIPSLRRVAAAALADVLQASAEKDDARARATLFERMTVRDIMTPNAHVIEPDADARDAARRMLYGEVKRLFVEDEGRLVGVITQTDIAHAVGSGRL